MKKLIAAGVFLTMACIIAGRANAASVGTIETSSSGAAYTLDNASGQYPVVTQILSQPGTVNGLTYTNWAFFANDGTGSIDVFGKMPTGSTYTPTVGDAITATGTYSPFDQIPELATLTAITKTSSGNVVPAPTVTTIPTINVAPTLPFNVAGYMLEVDNVTISGEGNAGAAFGKTNSPTGALITDGNENSMTLFYWPTSYSVANANMFGRTIPTVPVSMTGFVDFFASVGHAEFSPITITAPPALWQPASGSSNWDGTTLSWSTSAGPVADVSFSTATFDDSGLANGSTVNITSGTSALYAGAITVSNSGGVYAFSGGTVAGGPLAKIGSGTLLVNNALQMPVIVTAGTLGGAGTIGAVTVGSGATLTAGAPGSGAGQLSINGNANFSAGGAYLWTLGSSLLDNSNGTAGTNWNLLAISGGSLNFGGGAALSLSFANSAETPNSANLFWDNNHTWTIASGASALMLGGSISESYPAVGTFSLQAAPGTSNLQLDFIANNHGPRTLFWSANGTTGLNDGSGNWSNPTWTDGTTAHLSFDSTRPDSAVFGNMGGSGGAAVISVSGAVTAGSLTFNGGNSAQYTLNGGTIAVNAGLSAGQSATLNSAMVLGYSQTWSVSSGTLAVNGGISETQPSNLAVSGSGTLTLGAPATYSGGTTLNGGVISVLGSYYLPVGGPLATAAGTRVALNGYPQTLGALSGSGSINMGSGGSLTFGDSSSQTFNGVINGSGAVTYAGSGTTVFSGPNTFTGAVNINAGYLQVAGDGNLGNLSNSISLNGGGLATTASFSSSRAVTVGINNGVLEASGSATLTLNGLVTGPGALSKFGAGILVLTNSNNSYQGGTVLTDGTVSISSPGNLGNSNGIISFTGYAASTLQFTSPMTLSNNIQFPLAAGSADCYLDTQGNNVTLTGQLVPVSGSSACLSFNKIGSGTLTLAGTSGLPPPGTYGDTYINQGTLVLTAVDPSTGYSALGSAEDIEVRSGAALQLSNVALEQQSTTATEDFLDLYSGSTFQGSGTSSIAHRSISIVLNYSNGYSPSSVTFQTTSSSDVLSVLNSVQQFGANSGGNNYGNATATGGFAYTPSGGTIGTTYISGSQDITIHVTGPGRVQIQDGGCYGTYSDNTFGGDWSVDQGILQVGPYQANWAQQNGQLLNALGFKTPNGQVGAAQADPNIPNAVTVHSGGMFAVAVDQVNPNGGSTAAADSNTSNEVQITPDYLRNPITLSGGTLAATGYEMDFNAGAIDSTPVTARLGGNFVVTGSGASTIDTYDPIGGTGARTVQLLAGSYTLSSPSALFAAGTAFTYNTSWAGTLTVNGGGFGGEFDLFRDNGGTVSVASGASINVTNSATVNVGGTETFAALYDETGNGNSVNFSGGVGGGHLVFSRTADTSLGYAGNISGALDLTQEGTDALVLSGSNTYTGGTYVESGTLVIASASALPVGRSLTVGISGTPLFDPAAAYSPVTPTFSPIAAVATVPEPASLTLLLVFAGCAGGIWLRRASKARLPAL